MGSPFCTCNSPNFGVEKSIQKEERAKFQESISQNNYTVKQKSIAAQRIELESQLDKQKQEFLIMKRAYDTIKTESDTHIQNKQIIRRLSQEKDQYEKQLIENKMKSQNLNHEIQQYKQQINNMESQLAQLS